MSDEIRCPMCGKLNPPDAEVCQYCGARLHPLRPGEAPRPISTSELESTLPEWMKSLREEAQSPESEEVEPLPPEEEEPEEQAPEEELPDWLSALGEEGVLEEEEEEELPDWLSDLGLEEPKREEEAPKAEKPKTEAQEEKQPAEEEAAPAEELPEWLGELGSEQPKIPAEEEAAPAEELPEWLGELGAEQPEIPAEEEAAPAEELPEWLGELGAEQPKIPAEEEAAAAEELPEWLGELGSEQSEIPAEEEAAPAEELPGWLGELGSEQPEIPAEEEAAPAEELPEWLGELGSEQPEIPAEEETTPAKELPEWLGELSAKQPEPPAEEEAAPAEELPEWLGELGAEQPEVPAEEEAAPAEEAPKEAEELLYTIPPFQPDALADIIGGEETPDWLETLTPEAGEELLGEEAPTTAPAEGEEVAAPSEAEGIVGGELPSWVEAMRPVEIPLEDLGVQEAVETRGPLAGLRGVLPPIPKAVIPKKKVGIAASRLTLSVEEERQTKMLAQVVKDEFAPKPIPQKAKLGGGRLLRWLLGLLLLTVAFMPLVLPVLRAPMPQKILPAALAAKQLVDKVPPNGVVLVGVDYNLGFSAEMEAAAAPVLSHLMDKHVRFVAISTQPVGGDMAARLIEHVLAKNGDYHEGKDYLNLGYLPGGTAALYAFARAPRAVLPNAAGHSAIWNNPILKNIHTVDNFDMVLVITEDPDTARAWVEQVRPTLSHAPLVMIISAQAEPLVEPYYETAQHQVAGIVTGLEGGVAYGEATGRQATKNAQAVWSSYSLITLTAVILLVFAGIYEWVLGLRESKQSVAEEAED